jgi:hypothetical protein
MSIARKTKREINLCPEAHLLLSASAAVLVDRYVEDASTPAH